MTKEFPKHLLLLLEERSLSQSRLAARAGVSTHTINNAILGKQKNWQHRTARRVLKALEDVKPLTMLERARYAQYTGLPDDFENPAAQLSEHALMSVRSVMARFQNMHKVLSPLSDHEAQLVYSVLELSRKTGTERVQTILDSVAEIAGVDLEDAEEIVMTIKHPARAVSLGGSTPAIEEVETQYVEKRARPLTDAPSKARRSS